MERSNATTTEFQRAGVEPARPVRWLDRKSTHVLLLALHVILFSLALAPFGQFYLALVALVPYLLFVHAAKNLKQIFGWGWACGFMFNGLNLWFLYFVSLPGLFALILYLGVYWGVLGVLIRSLGLLDEFANTKLSSVQRSPWRVVSSVFLIAAIWITGEWLRGTVMTGLPWLFLGHTQTPLLVMCQIADATGAYGVSFWLVLINAWVALFVIDRFRFERLKPAFWAIVLVCAGVCGYGLWRLRETPSMLSPGPTILVVQPNFPQSNTGEKGASIEEIVEFHVKTTEAALAQCRTDGKNVDLIVWSETMMPPINHQARQGYVDSAYGTYLKAVHEQLGNLAYRHRVGLLTGGKYGGNFRFRDITDEKGVPHTYYMPTDERNSTYFYEPLGVLSPDRYDKIHLVPFGEFVPFKASIPWLYNLLMKLGPPDMQYYQLTAGEPNAMTVFELVPVADGIMQPTVRYRFVTPICFEDIVPPKVTDFFRGEGDLVGQKRADILINLTNDGWFKFNEQPQHLQVATFRSIENRVPTARSVNTGISGFVDSVGRQTGLLARFKDGWSAERVMIDRRLTFYTRYGDVFALTCVLITAASVVLALVQRQLFGAMPRPRIDR